MFDSHPRGNINPLVRLGLNVEGKSSDEAFEFAQLLRWNVRIASVYALDPEPLEPKSLLRGLPLVQVPEKLVTMYDSPWTNRPEIFAFVGKQYTVIQNEALKNVAEIVIKETNASFLTAGWLPYEQKVVITLDLKLNRQVGGVDPVNFYMFGATSHDGHYAFTFSLLPVRLSCWNMITVNMPDVSFAYKAKHTRNIPFRIQDLQGYLGNIGQLIDGFMDKANSMYLKDLSETEFEKITKELISIALDLKNPRNQGDLFDILEDDELNSHFSRVLSIYESSPMVSIAGTAWGGYQAFLEWFQFVYPFNSQGIKDESYARASRAVFADSNYIGISTLALNAFAQDKG
jgi:hypothetical protein